MSERCSKLPLDELSSGIRELITRTGASVFVGYPGWLRLLLQRGVEGVTLGRRIYLHEKARSRERKDLHGLIVHELTHVRQVQRLGLPRFLYLYLHEYIELRGSGLTASEAYLNISYEIEASRAELEEMNR